jgi:5'-methylthioadenosine phosphorylase
MSAVKIGIIGGTGLDNPDIIEKRKESIISTPYGSAEVVQGTISGVPCVSR